MGMINIFLWLIWQGYLDEIWNRMEIPFSSEEDIIDWLSDNGKKNKESYRKVAQILAEPTDLKERITTLSTTSQARALESQIGIIRIVPARNLLDEQLREKLQSIERFDEIRKEGLSLTGPELIERFGEDVTAETLQEEFLLSDSESQRKINLVLRIKEIEAKRGE